MSRSLGRAKLVLLAVVVAGLVLGCSDSKKSPVLASPIGPAVSDPSNDLVSYKVPSGWHVSDDGLVLAQDEADLTADVPAGPRITAVVGAATDDDPIGITNELLAGPSFDIIDGPTDTTVSGAKAVSMLIRRDNVILGFIGVHAPGRDSVVFNMECPVERYEDVQSMLASAPGLQV